MLMKLMTVSQEKNLNISKNTHSIKLNLTFSESLFRDLSNDIKIANK